MPLARLPVLLLLCALVLVLRDSSPPSAAAILERADHALSRVEHVRYRFTFEGTGSMAGEFAGEAAMIRRTDERDSVMRSTVNPTAAPGYEAFTDGSRVQLIEHGVRRFRYGSVAGAGSGLFTIGTYGTMFEYVRPYPFRGLAQRFEIEYLGEREIGGVACHAVIIERRGLGGNADDTWYFGREDGLPRGQRWVAVPPGPAASYTYVLTELDVATSIDAASLVLAPPDGYRVINADSAADGVGRPAPEWSLMNDDGEEVRLRDLRGRYVVLAMWASWCSICHRVLPDVDLLAQAFEGRPVSVFGASTWEQDDEDARLWIASHKPSWTHLTGGDDVALAYGLSALPGLFLIGPDGTLLESRIGPTGADVSAIRVRIERELL